MFPKNAKLARVVTATGFFGLATLTIIVVSAMVTKEFIGPPIVLLILFGWGGMLLLQVVLPIIAVIQLLVWLNRKLFSQA